MDAQFQPAHAADLTALRQKLRQINHAIAALEALEKSEVTGRSALPTNKVHNVVSIDCFRRKSEEMTKAAQCPPATSVEG